MPLSKVTTPLVRITPTLFWAPLCPSVPGLSSLSLKSTQTPDASWLASQLSRYALGITCKHCSIDTAHFLSLGQPNESSMAHAEGVNPPWEVCYGLSPSPISTRAQFLLMLVDHHIGHMPVQNMANTSIIKPTSENRSRHENPVDSRLPTSTYH